MPGPAPSPNARRRNAPRIDWHTLPTDPEEIARRVGPIPELPPGHWQPTTKEKWAAWWRLPVAVEWTESDRGTVERMAFLWDLVLKGEGSPAVHGRLDVVESLLGMNPKARVQLRWGIDGEELPDVAHNGGVRRSRDRGLRVVK